MGPLPGPKRGLLDVQQKRIVLGDTCDGKETIGKGYLGREQKGKGTQDGSAMWLTVLSFMVVRLVSRFAWPITLTQGPN